MKTPNQRSFAAVWRRAAQSWLRCQALISVSTNQNQKNQIKLNTTTATPFFPKMAPLTQNRNAYDAAGNLTFRTNNALVHAFGVNSLNELTNITRSGTLTVSGKTTSRATNVAINGLSAALYGDWTFATNGFTVTNGLNSFTAIASDAYGHADTNAISAWLPATNSFTYDANGNLTFDGTNNFAFDDENQLVSAWQTNNWRSDFVYDGKLRCRIIKEYNYSGSWTLAKETHLVYDGMLVVQERDGSNNVQVNYTRGNDLSGSLQGAGGIGGLLARTDYTQTNTVFQTAFYHCDGNGNITALFSQNGLILASYLYDPYGRTLAKSGPLADANLFRFSSKMWHENTGLYYYGYRFYSPNLQRWLNCDPIRWQTPYGSARHIFRSFANDPVSNVDAFGRMSAGSTPPPANLSTIICQGGKAIPRVSDLDKSGNSQCVVACMTKHEQVHADEANAAHVCDNAPDNVRIIFTPAERVAGEVRAYEAEKKCLEEALKTATPPSGKPFPDDYPPDCPCRQSNVKTFLQTVNDRLSGWKAADPENKKTWPQDDI